MNDEITVLFVGNAIYKIPLDATSKKKFQYLSKICDIHVFALVKDGKRLRKWQECGCEFIGIPRSLPRWQRNPWFLWQLMIELIRLSHKKKCMVVIVQSFQHSIIPLILKHFGIKCKVIVEVHGDWLNSHFLYHSVKAKTIIRQALKLIGMWAFKHADAIRAVSSSTRSLIPIKDKPIYQFPAFTDIELFLNAYEKHKLNKKQYQNILFVGSLIRLKGVDDLMTAFKIIAGKHKNARLIFVGEGPKLEELQKRVISDSLSDRVSFTGHLTQQELAELMVNSYCLALPSLTEGLPRVLIEAMACALPLIGTKVGGIPELIEDKVNGLLIPPSNPNELALALDWILSHPEEAEKMGKQGKQRVEAIFSVDRYVTEYKQMIYEVAEK